MTITDAVLGIDLGTSTTVAMLAGSDGPPRPLLFDASPLLPSGVFATPDGELLTGAAAERAAVAYPAGFEPTPKLRIGERAVLLGAREVSVVDLITAVLRRVASEAIDVAGGLPATVVLTHPATWSPARLAVLAESAARAGLGSVRLVAEPLAAAAYRNRVLGNRLPPGKCLVVCDLGAGTFDVSAVRFDGTADKVIAAASLGDAGGLDLDAAVVGMARNSSRTDPAVWRRLDWPQSPADQEARQQLWRAARAVKEHMSRHGTGDLRLPLLDATIHLSRTEFEALAGPLLERTVDVTLSTLAQARISPETVGGVFVVGGGARDPLAATLLHRAMRIAPTVVDAPELVVASGSLYIAAPPTPEATHPLSAAPAPPATPYDQWRAAPGTPVVPFSSSPPTSPPAPPRTTPVAPPAAPSTPRPAPPVRSRRRRWLVATVAAVAVLAAAGGAGAVLWRASHDGPVRDLELVAEMDGDRGDVSSLAFSPDSKRLAAGGIGTVRLWNVAKPGTAETRLTGEHDNDDLTSLRFSPDGHALIAGDLNTITEVNLADASRDRVTVSFSMTNFKNVGIPGGVHDIVFRPDGSFAAVGYVRDGYLCFEPDRTRDTWLGLSIKAQDGANAAHAAFAPGGALVAAADGPEVRIFTTASGAAVGAPIVNDKPTALTFSPDGRTLAVAIPSTEGARVKFADVKTLTLRGETLAVTPDVVQSMAYNADGTLIATGLANTDVILWDASSATIITRLNKHQRGVRAVAFSPDGKWLATGDGEGTVRLWRIER